MPRFPTLLVMLSILSIVVGLLGGILAIVVTAPLSLVILVSWSLLLIAAIITGATGYYAVLQRRSPAKDGALVAGIFGAGDNIKRLLNPHLRTQLIQHLTHHTPSAASVAVSPTFLHFSPTINWVISIVIFAWAGSMVGIVGGRLSQNRLHRL
ncbi:MAG: hypothetical protein OWS74_08935 [Firmicutes bacterium]|nr:hypothetical protein [Bacillota bacterium]